MNTCNIIFIYKLIFTQEISLLTNYYNYITLIYIYEQIIIFNYEQIIIDRKNRQK